MESKYCMTCGHKLTPPTSIPRMSEGMLAHSDNRAYRDAQATQRSKELAEGKIGLYGEAKFCGSMCAAFYGRACAEMFEVHAYGGTLRETVRRILDMYTWVTQRKARR